MSAATDNATMATAARPTHEFLEWSRDVLDPALRAAVGTLPDAVRRVAEFHFGWCDESGCPTTDATGASISPRLALLTAEAPGGAHDVALPAAVAVELIHGFARLHDEVIEGGVAGRHARSACSAFGIGAAILAGSALQVLAFDTLTKSGGARAHDEVRMTCAALQDRLEGQMTAKCQSGNQSTHEETP